MTYLKLPIHDMSDELIEYQKYLNSNYTGYTFQFIIDNETLILNISNVSSTIPYIYDIVYPETGGMPLINQNRKNVETNETYSIFLSTFDKITRLLLEEYMQNDM